MSGFETEHRQRDADTRLTQLYEQSFQVPFSYSVAFTHDLFAMDNPLFVETLCKAEPQKRHRCLFFIDEGVQKANPDLAAKIGTYIDHHASAIELVADPVPVAGGEKIKSELTYIEAAQDAISKGKFRRE